MNVALNTKTTKILGTFQLVQQRRKSLPIHTHVPLTTAGKPPHIMTRHNHGTTTQYTPQIILLCNKNTKPTINLVNTKPAPENVRRLEQIELWRWRCKSRCLNALKKCPWANSVDQDTKTKLLRHEYVTAIVSDVTTSCSYDYKNAGKKKTWPETDMHNPHLVIIKRGA